MASFDPKVANEVLDEMIAQHQDVADGATPEVIQNWLDSQNPHWIEGFCKFNGLDQDKVVAANICFSFEEDEQFKKLPPPNGGRPPTDQERAVMYFDRCNRFAERLGALQPFDKPNYRLRGDYGGPY